jgi:hypothetical protein
MENVGGNADLRVRITHAGRDFVRGALSPEVVRQLMRRRIEAQNPNEAALAMAVVSVANPRRVAVYDSSTLSNHL